MLDEIGTRLRSELTTNGFSRPATAWVGAKGALRLYKLAYFSVGNDGEL
jgi:hypothetical protein